MAGRIGKKFFSRTPRRRDPNNTQRAFFGSLSVFLARTLATAATLRAHYLGSAALVVSCVVIIILLVHEGVDHAR